MGYQVVSMGPPNPLLFCLDAGLGPSEAGAGNSRTPNPKLQTLSPKPYSRSPKVGNPIASILKSNAEGIPGLFVLNPVSNFLGFTINQWAHGPKGTALSQQDAKPGPSIPEAYILVGLGLRGLGL